MKPYYEQDGTPLESRPIANDGVEANDAGGIERREDIAGIPVVQRDLHRPALWSQQQQQRRPDSPLGSRPRIRHELVRWAFNEFHRLLKPGCCCCCCCGGGGPDPQFARWSLWLDDAVGFKQMVVWDKGPMGMGWHYRRSYETVLVGEKPGAACRWFDETDKVENIIRHIPKIIPTAADHPTPKRWKLRRWGDCREILPTLDSVDVTITDPPYGVGLVTKTSDYRGSTEARSDSPRSKYLLYQDDPEHVRQLISEVMPMVLLATERALVFTGTKMLWAYPEPQEMGCVFTVSGAGRCSWGFRCMQPILFYGSDPFLQDGRGGRPNSFRDEQPNREHFDHPCPKPLSWMKWAILRASRDGETVLDPFCGTGTTLRAAKDTGRRAIGIEIEERYCEIAAKRLAQGVLFAPDRD